MANRQLIFRVENGERKGPYTFGNFDILNHHNFDMERWPTAWSDRILKDVSISEIRERRYGFKSMRKLLNWFSRAELRVLFDAGWAISIYAVTVVAHGDKQSIFSAEGATLLFRFSKSV
jgi:hypothetical protein